MPRLLTVSAALGLLACGSGSSEPRTHLEEESVSFAELANYAVDHKRGAAILTSGDSDKKRSTIVIRSVRYDERHDRSPEALLEATAEALAALPNAVVSEPTKIDHATHTAMRFDVTFRPHKKRRAYQRSHVVVLAEEHAYHVLHTVPEGKLGAAAKDFARLVDSLEEEI